MQTFVPKQQNSSPSIVISFDTEYDRIKGYGVLIHSNHGFKGVGKNRFIVTREHYHLLQNSNIKFQEIQ